MNVYKKMLAAITFLVLAIFTVNASPMYAFGVDAGISLYTVDGVSAMPPDLVISLAAGWDVWSSLDLYGRFSAIFVGKSLIPINPLLSPSSAVGLSLGAGIMYRYAGRGNVFAEIAVVNEMYNTANVGIKHCFSGLDVRAGIGWLFFRDDESGFGYSLNLSLGASFTGTSTNFRACIGLSMDIDSYMLREDA